MIDFRYHLISIIAVFLALGLGILMGTNVLNDALVSSLRDDLSSLRDKVESQHDLIDRLDRRDAAANAFANEAMPWLTADALQGRVVVLIQLEGTEGDMVNNLRDSIVDSGGEVPTTIVLTEDLALQDQVTRDELALVLDSTSGSPADLRVDVGAALATRLAAASKEASTAARPQDVAQERLRELVQQLRDGGFISVDATDEQTLVPSNSLFLVVGGSDGESAFDVTGLVTTLVDELAGGGAPTLVAESGASTWGMVVAVRTDPEAQARVATVDQADTVEGRIEVVLGLERAFEGLPDHYGVGEGATQVLPDPAEVP